MLRTSATHSGEKQVCHWLFVFLSKAFLLHVFVCPVTWQNQACGKMPPQDGWLALVFMLVSVKRIKSQLGGSDVTSQTGVDLLPNAVCNPFCFLCKHSYMLWFCRVSPSRQQTLSVCLCSYNWQKMDRWLQLCLLVLSNGYKRAFTSSREFAVVLLYFSRGLIDWLFVFVFLSLGSRTLILWAPSQLSDS